MLVVLVEWCGLVLDDLCEFSFVICLVNLLVEDKIIVYIVFVEVEIVCGCVDLVISEFEELILEYFYYEVLWW